ncbi:MAG: HEAT repeat domain-containing protein [Bdellovibrionota bacterium]
MQFNLAEQNDQATEVSADVPQMDLWGEYDDSFDFTLPPETSNFVSAPLEQVVEKKNSNRLPLIVAAFLCLVGGGYVLLEDSPSQDGILDSFGEIFKQLVNIFDSQDSSESVNKKPQIVNKVKPVLPGESQVKAPDNPYWSLPNHIVGDQEPMSRVWAPQEEQSLNAGLGHRFNYQRYRTVLSIRDMRLAGSESVLWDALNEPKLWVRMRAAMALADFGFELSLDVIEQTLGNASSSLVANFFKRFVGKSTHGERYVLRQALRVLDERGRLVVLKVLKSQPNKLNNLYLVAAQFDPGKKVTDWLRYNQPELTPSEYLNYKQIVLGRAVYQMPKKQNIEPVEVPEPNSSTSDLLDIDGIEIYSPQTSSSDDFDAEVTEQKEG